MRHVITAANVFFTEMGFLWQIRCNGICVIRMIFCLADVFWMYGFSFSGSEIDQKSIEKDKFDCEVSMQLYYYMSD